jgi:hypothetical protein
MTVAIPKLVPSVAAAVATAAALRIRRWLLQGPAQIRSGEQAGGVAGWLDANGRPDYVYAEITGYYLHWLAEETGADDRISRRENAQAAVAWCERRCAAGALPATRIYLGAAEPDWRNQAVFFFDLSMLLCGLSAVTQAGLAQAPRSLLEHLVTQLDAFALNESLVAIRALNTSTQLPDRWSTRPDRFLVKAATRVLAAQALVALPSRLQSACERLVAMHTADTSDAPIQELHPTLYFLEGALLAGHQHWNAVAAPLQRMLAMAQAAGELPESADSPLLRTDIIAQALRIGVLLRQNGGTLPADAQLDRLASALIARVHGDGAVPFRVDAPAPQLNAWCAMFAEQALRWYGRWRAESGSRSIPISALV